MANKVFKGVKSTLLPDTYVNSPVSVAPLFSALTAYTKGELVYNGLKLYRFTANHAAGAWTESDVEEVTVGSQLKTLNEDTTELKQDLQQLENSQVKEFLNDTISGTTYLQKVVDIPAGTYNLHIDKVTSDDTDVNYSNIVFYESGTQVLMYSASRNVEINTTITLTGHVNNINFYAAGNWGNSNGDDFEFKNVKIWGDTNLNKRFVTLENHANTSLYYDFFGNDHYFSHIFIDKINADSNAIIPCQSIFDFEIAHRLGFNVIEANVHKTATPGKYIVIHGVGGKIGGELMTTGGEDASDIVIADTSFADLRNNYVYRSQYEKYQIPVTSLEELISVCQRLKLIPIVTYVDSTEIRLLREGLGYNFILLNASRSVYDGMINVSPSLNATVAEVKSLIDAYGAPMMISVSSDSSYTDSEYTEMIEYAHSKNIMFGYWGSYMNVSQDQHMRDLGCDWASSRYQINDFESGNICNLTADINFEDFTYDSGVTVSDGVLTLPNGKHIYPNNISSQFLAKGSLHIRFSGTILLKMGSYINWVSITSDGSKDVYISSYFMNTSPGFTIEASGNAYIYNITYKASKC